MSTAFLFSTSNNLSFLLLSSSSQAGLSNDLRQHEYPYPVKSSNEVPDLPFTQSNTPISRTEKTVSGDLLYDQINDFNITDTSVGAATQDFEAQFDAFDCELADDFTIPPDVSWEITSIEFLGTTSGVPPPIFNIFIYEDDGGKPDVDGPGRLSYIKVNATSDDGLYTIALGPTPQLRSGKTYWLAVQAAVDFLLFGQLFWLAKFPQRGSPAQWQNPGGGFNVAMCTSFGARGSECNILPDFPDQLFRLYGNELPETCEMNGNECTMEGSECVCECE